jgi:hypothetical protein
MRGGGGTPVPRRIRRGWAMGPSRQLRQDLIAAALAPHADPVAERRPRMTGGLAPSNVLLAEQADVQRDAAFRSHASRRIHSVCTKR